MADDFIRQMVNKTLKQVVPTTKRPPRAGLSVAKARDTNKQPPQLQSAWRQSLIADESESSGDDVEERMYGSADAQTISQVTRKFSTPSDAVASAPPTVLRSPHHQVPMSPTLSGSGTPETRSIGSTTPAPVSPPAPGLLRQASTARGPVWNRLVPERPWERATREAAAAAVNEDPLVIDSLDNSPRRPSLPQTASTAASRRNIYSSGRTSTPRQSLTGASGLLGTTPRTVAQQDTAREIRGDSPIITSPRPATRGSGIIMAGPTPVTVTPLPLDSAIASVDAADNDTNGDAAEQHGTETDRGSVFYGMVLSL